MLSKILGGLIAIILVATILVPSISDVDDDPIDVLVIAGQSNAAYMPTTTVQGVTNVICTPEGVNGVVPLPSKNAYYYGTESVPILYGDYFENPSYDTTLASYGIHSMTLGDSWVIGGEEAAIASYYTAKSNREILIINVGAPGAPIHFFMPGATGCEYVGNVINDALTKLGDVPVNKLGFVWIQGEANKTTAVDTYKTRFLSILNWYDSLGFSECYMVETQPANSGNASTAQVQLCEDYENIHLASDSTLSFSYENGLIVSDLVHYSQKGRNIVGEDIANSIPSYKDVSFDLLMVVPLLTIVAIIVFMIPKPRD